MKSLWLAAALVSLPSFAGESPLAPVDKKLDSARSSTKSGAKKAEADTNQGLESARKSGKKGAKNLEKGANDAAKAFRKKVGTEK